VTPSTTTRALSPRGSGVSGVTVEDTLVYVLAGSALGELRR
jgi:hypothetical protein